MEDSIITQFARNIQRTQVAQELANLDVSRPGGSKPSGAPLVPDVPFDDLLFKPDSRPKNLKIGIIGAGMAGLYTAFILDKLSIPGVSYEILEASDRPGGRCFTHKFSDEQWDYYDIGAMRFPVNETMNRYRHKPDNISTLSTAL